MTLPLSIPPGQTGTASGDVESAITLGASSTLEIAADTTASLFGGILVAGSAAVMLEAGSVLFAPAATPAGVTVSLEGAGSELILAASTLSAFEAELAGLPVDALIDIAGCQITSVTTSALADGSYGLVLASAQGVLGTIGVASAPPTLIVAVPDGDGGSLLLSGPAPPPPVAAIAASSAPAGDFIWADGAGTRWADPASWRGISGAVARAPGRQDTVTIAGRTQGLTTLAGAGNCAVLDASGLVALTGPFTATALSVGLASSDALVLTAGTNMAVTSAAVHAGILSVQGAVLSVAGTLSLAGFLDGNSASVITASMVELAGGTIRLSADTGLLVGDNGGRTPGGVTVAHDGKLFGTGTIEAAVTLLGAMEVSTGTLSVFGAITGSGTITLDTGATLFASGGLGAATIDFTGPGTTLETFGGVGGALVTGFGFADVLEIAGATMGALTWTPVGSGGTLDLGLYGAIAIDLTPGLNPQHATFSEAADGLGGVSITVIPCFTASTRLRTPSGWIEAGRVTPRTWLCTAGGAARRAIWIGRTKIEGWRRIGKPYLDPVLLRAGALGPGHPEADLRLSPLHGVLLATAIGPRVVPAVALCDGRRITRDRTAVNLEYVHIALDRHDAILAEGLPCESFLPHGPDPRGQFTLSAGQHPRATRPIAERLDHGPMLQSLRDRYGLAETGRGAALGRGTMDRARPSQGLHALHGWADAASRIELLIDGQVEWRGRRDTWRADLEAAGLSEGVAAFTATIPRPSPEARLSLRALG